MILLGVDNKVGVVVIMDVVCLLMVNFELKYGKICVFFMLDEEIGRGVDKVDMERLGVEFGYIVDGEKRGILEDEIFLVDGVIIKI